VQKVTLKRCLSSCLRNLARVLVRSGRLSSSMLPSIHSWCSASVAVNRLSGFTSSSLMIRSFALVTHQLLMRFQGY
jgi:hypothetical protein